MASADMCGPDRSGYYTHMHPEIFEIDWVAYYDRFDRDSTALQRTAHHERNLRFGDHPDEFMDIYYPEELSSAPHPVMYYMMGGGKGEGHPHFYGFIAEPFIKRGVIFVSAGYAKVGYPGTVDSALKGFSFVRSYLADRGGDTAAMYMSGHSGGAWAASNLSVREDWQKASGLPIDAIKGTVLLSGIYDLTQAMSKIPDADKISPIHLVRRAPQHSIIVFGWPDEPSRKGTDNSKYGVTGFAFAEAVEAVGGSVEVLALENYDHAQVGASLGYEDSEVCKAALKMIASRS